MSDPAPYRWDSEVRLLAWLATCVSVFSFLFYFRHGEVLLYGDAVAHMNIARRVFDSQTPGPLQLGTVWLPLPHLLMIPFLISDSMWQQGVGGSLPSMIAYVFGVVGVFRLVRDLLSAGGELDSPVRVAAWTAAIIYGANPNLIYMQSTAMGESLYLALSVWAVAYFLEFARGDSNAVVKCGWCLAAASWTRYDGWFLTIAAVASVGVIAGLSRKDGSNSRPKKRELKARRQERAQVAKFILIAAAAPALWLVYNGIVYRNPLEFENGPYSAKAIEKRTQTAGTVGHPGSGNVAAASLYFLKAAQWNMADKEWLQKTWIALGLLALVAIQFSRSNPMPAYTVSRWLALGLLLIPLPFYALSIAYGGVPIFIPAWWPFSHYNVRYGLQVLPGFAVAVAILMHWAMTWVRLAGRLRVAASLAIVALVVTSYFSIWHADPICLSEAKINMRTRNQFERQIAGWLKGLPADSTLLMYLGDHVGAVQQAGIPLKRVINEGNHRTWRQPADPEGLWEHALSNPAHYADYVIAFEGDPVWQAVQGQRLKEVAELHTTGQARAIVYQTR